MKKYLIKLLLLLIAVVGCQSAYAYDFEVDGIFYNITDKSNKEVAVTFKNTSYKSYSGVINLPSNVSYGGENYTLTSISENAFYNCSGLRAITIPNTVTSIGERAFYECTALRSLVLGSGLKSIGRDAFIRSNSFKFIIPKVFWLGNTAPTGVFEVKAELNYVSTKEFSVSDRLVYPFLSSRFEVDDVIYVPVSPADRTCDVVDCNYNMSLKELTIDSLVSNKNVQLKVLNVNDYALYGCDALTTVTANNNGSIGNYAFQKDSKLTSIELGTKVTTIGSSAFKECSSLRQITIPDNISSLGASTFESCTSLKEIRLGRGLSRIPTNLFQKCSSLESINIPGCILTINDYAFSACTNLGDVTFESLIQAPQYFPDWTSTNHADNSVSSHEYQIEVNKGDLLSCTMWSDSESYDYLNIYINGSEISSLSGINMTKQFSWSCTDTETIVFKVEYKKDNSKSYGTDSAGIRNLALNNFPLSLGSNGSSPLFSNCKLDEVYIGRKLSYNSSSDYGYSPFYRNTSLRKVTITDAESAIYNNEFYGCSNLQEFSCGDGVESIGSRAFSGCSSLKSYLSGTNVESIGAEAFSDCTALTSFTSNAAVPPVCGAQALDDINKWECTLYVPTESKDEYQQAAQWKEFFFIDESGIEDVVADDATASKYDVEIFTLSGVKVSNSMDNLAPGVYIKRQGKRTEKVMIR